METRVAWIDDVNVLTVMMEDTSLLLHQEESPIIYWQYMNKHFPTKVEEIINATTARLTFPEELPLGEDLILKCGEAEIPVYPRAIVRTKWFDTNYSALNSELGALYKKTNTTFAIWAPTATAIKLYLNNNSHIMNRQKNGIWKLKIDGDWHGYSYDYEIIVNGEIKRVNDPYAKAMLANSSKSVIVDFARTEMIQSNRPKIEKLQDAIIYELHVRDATIQEESGVLNRGKYLGLTEKSTTTPNGFSTALSYLKELGITHVQLLPINDFARVDELTPEKDYNWGYDPLFFQVPEGSYASTANDPITRLTECKKMIQTIHEEGISVILDVVYNHVFVMEESPFEKLVPGYFFRYHADGSLSNGTGVGNDFASEREMARKFIIDTIDFWLTEYKVDGFRFDLMGAMDIETMKQIQLRCAKEEIPIMLLGEGWELHTALAAEDKATSFQSHQLMGIRFFNDHFRDSLKGNLFDCHDTGYANGNGRFNERMPHLITGSALEEYGQPFVSELDQTINYVECHDNHTLWDRLLITNKHFTDTDRKKMHQIATAITLLSQGVPFIHAGQEWFRSKLGDENSYISGDKINQLDWKKREKENENIQFIKTLIALRKKYEVFRLPSKDEVRRRFHILDTPAPVFGFALFGIDEDFSIYINPTNEQYELQLPSTGTWKISATNDFNRDQQEIKGEFTSVGSYEVIVLKKSR